MNTRFTISLCMIALVVMAIRGPHVEAFETHNNTNKNNDEHCSSIECHPGFTGDNDASHTLHTGGDNPMIDDCYLCHMDSDEDNALMSWSAYNNNNGYGCAGCHGRDYGATIERNYGDFLIAGKPKASGWGLRRLHALKGVPKCIFCHADKEPLPENVNPPYYLDMNADVNITNSCDDGLDNDGDGLYDNVDPDCADARIAYSSD
jgi:hypothetical protein